MHRPKPPLSKGGASAPPRRGDSAGKACGTSYLFTLHYSLNPPGIVTAEVVDAQTKAPLVKGGCLGTAEAGGFRRLAGFHIGLYFWESACCGIPQTRLRRASSLWQGSLWVGYRYLAEDFSNISLSWGAMGVFSGVIWGNSGKVSGFWLNEKARKNPRLWEASSLLFPYWLIAL